ncbi:hypothetical protein NG796_17475 [Laspinema sp. A4]|uniref:hypothetical protein n=1 Tax=Laspinema sp. D2d TaxID=2953686 RepID=UPI0021BAA0C6|nr:hypothetical protein [Laspinema sp. D2d]MCT7985065.1 hypothetical protein [Laspinema sp. D2d]
MIIKDLKKGGLRTSALALGLFALLLPACQQDNQAYNETEQQPTTTEYQESPTAPGPGRESTATSPGQRGMTTGESTTAMEGEQMETTPENISSNPENFIGQTVTVRGDVDEMDTSADTFLMSDDRALAGEGILVINSTSEPFGIPDAEDMRVQVSGEVRQFRREEITSQYGLDLDPQLYSEYEDQPVIIAESMALSPTGDQVSDNPDAFFNRPVAMEGQIDEMLAPNTFSFDGDNVIVINADQGQVIPENQDIVVTGELRPLDMAALQSEYNLNWDAEMQQRIQSEYSDRLVLVADGIYPNAE